jgi:hypothetical protein
MINAIETNLGNRSKKNYNRSLHCHIITRRVNA